MHAGCLIACSRAQCRPSHCAITYIWTWDAWHQAGGRARTWRARGMGMGPLAASAAAPEGSASSPTSGSAARPRSPRADGRTCAQPGLSPLC